ncbi:hypothetical protein [uncultured Tenacibaculum sp.]|uniref:hypothetical protein n=1 Tax=Tenacibaculum sp. ZS6-P6 TaxID=3447503 RepID=UPI002623A961|nr:hypothetical protein [uncultured Tenacibaculum sp.]
MSKFLHILFFVFITQITYSQIINPKRDSFSSRKSRLIDNMVDHFEDIICKKYRIDKNHAHNAFKKYIIALNNNFHFITQDSKQKKTIDSTFVTKKSIKLLLNSHRILIDYIWIKEKENRTRQGFKSLSELDSETINKMSPTTLKWFKEQEKRNDILVINYFDSFSEKIMTEANNKDLTDLITSFRETSGYSPQITASALLNLKEEDYKNLAIKTFIAFQLYYAYLNSHVTYE